MNVYPHEYYSDRFIQAKIAYHCMYREVIIIKHLEEKDVTLRPLKIFKPEHFRWIYETRYHMQNIPFDIYISNASVRMPKLPHTTNVETRKYLSEIWNDIISGYDYFVDLDASSLEDEKKIVDWAKQIRLEMLEQGQKDSYPIEIWTTGSGGAHIIHKGIFDPLYVKNNIMDIACKLNIPLRQPVKMVNNERFIPDNGVWRKIEECEEPLIVKKPFLDNGIYDIRRIRRVPFSIHSKTGIPMKRVL